jgi:hypothetical protein
MPSPGQPVPHGAPGHSTFRGRLAEWALNSGA